VTLWTRFRLEGRHLFRLSWPVILSQVGTMMMGLIDTFVVGRYSSLELAGVASGSSIFWTLVMVGLGLLNGMDPIVAQAHGANEPKRAHRCLGVALQFCMIYSLLAIPPVLWLAKNMELVGATPDVAKAAEPFLRMISFSLLPLLLFSALQRYWQCFELVVPFTVIIVLANILNYILNLAFVTGRWGFPAMGAEGVALATIACRIFTLLAALAVTIYEWRKREPHIQAWTRLGSLLRTIDRSMTRTLFRLGLPAAGHMTLEVSAFSLTTLLVARLGAETLATHHIVLNIASFAFMFPLGLSAATATRVGYHIGRLDRHQAFAAGWLGILSGALIMSVSAVILYLFPEWLLGFFTSDPKVMTLGASIIFLCVLFQIFDGVQVVSAGALRGIGDTRTALLSNLLGHWGIGLPVGLSLCFWYDRGLPGLWIGLALGLFLVSVINTIFWKRREQDPALGAIGT
jgi:MATE family multidrug resistance protein